MTYRSSGLLRRALDHYAEHGLRSLLDSSARFLYRQPVKIFIKCRKLSRSELEQRGRERDAIWYAGEEEPIHMTLPSNKELAEEFRKYPLAYEPEQSFICELSNCHLLGPAAVGLTANGKWINDTISHTEPKKSHLGSEESSFRRRILRIRRKSAPTYDARYVLPLVSVHRSYYHWMVECIPKLRLLEIYTQRTGREPAILVDSESRAFITQTLSLAGYPPDRLDEWDGNEHYIRNLLIPTHRPHLLNYGSPDKYNYYPSRADLQWIRNRMRKNAVTDSDSGCKRVYVSRQNVPPERGRKVINDDVLAGVLEEFGFESYVLEELPFSEQVRLFADAEIVMGPHGAGLFNMIFSDAPTVVELHPRRKIKPFFYFISEMMGFEYHGVVTAQRNGNLVVNAELLYRALKRGGINPRNK